MLPFYTNRWAFYQIATLVPDVYQVEMPPQVNAALEFFRITIELDSWNVHMSCYGFSGFGSQLGFLIAWPIIGIAFTPLIGLMLALLLKQTTPKQLAKSGLKRGDKGFVDAVLLGYALPLTMLILFFAFPPVTSLAFRAFEDCTHFSDEVGEGSSYMISYRKHYAVDCHSDELSDTWQLAWAAIFIYPVGVLVLSAWLLFVARSTLLLEENSTPYTRGINILHAPFLPSVFYFEIIDLAKKLLLIGFASLVSPGSLLQLMVAVVASLLFLVLHLQAKPYKRPMDNMLATTINLSLVVFFFWCSLLQTGSLGDKGDIESGRLSNVGVGVSILMLISIVGVLLVASLLFVLEVAAKTATEVSERRKREKWAGHTTDPPTTNWPGDKSYAAFLSHYKMEAASDARLLHDMLAKMLRYPIFLDSAKLTDLRALITDGVADSDVLVLMGTAGYVTRPWCGSLLLLYTACIIIYTVHFYLIPCTYKTAGACSRSCTRGGSRRPSSLWKSRTAILTSTRVLPTSQTLSRSWGTRTRRGSSCCTSNWART